MDKRQALSTAISITNEILELLDSGEFDRVNELEVKRKLYIEQAFARSIEQIDLIKAQLLKNLNQQVVDKLNQFKQSVVIEQTRLRTASKATRAYLAHDSDPR